MKKCVKRNNRINFKAALFFITIFVGLNYSCKADKAFTKADWEAKLEGIYYLRAPIANDLVENQLNKNICYDELIELLGSPIRSESLKKVNHIYYEIEVKSGYGADDAWIKYLDIELNKDSCFYKATQIKRR